MTANFDKETLRKRIISARKKMGLNKSQLAEKAGVTPAAITQIENGSRVPTTPVLHRISSILEVSIDYLLGKTNDSELKDLLQTKEVATFYRSFKALDPKDKETILKNIEFLKSQKD